MQPTCRYENIFIQVEQKPDITQGEWNHAMILLYNTLLPHLPNLPANQGKHVTKSYYDIIQLPIY